MRPVDGSDVGDGSRLLAAAILTGGRATRFGGARKAQLRVGGRTIIERQLQALAGVVHPVYAVSSPDGDGEGGLEVVAIYSRACAPVMRARIESGRLDASVLPEGVRVAEVAEQVVAAYDPLGLVFVNVNTPHDYERANTLLEGSNASRDRIMDELGP